MSAGSTGRARDGPGFPLPGPPHKVLLKLTIAASVRNYRAEKERDEAMASRSRLIRGIGVLVVAGVLWPGTAAAQAPNARQTASQASVEEPDAQRIQGELGTLLDRYPPALRGALAFDPSLLNNQSYLASYPALVSFLAAHP